jgi:hypothetical protein
MQMFWNKNLQCEVITDVILDMQQRYAHLGMGRKCTWTIISSSGSLDIVMKGRKVAVDHTVITKMQCLTCFHQRNNERRYSVQDKLTCQ